MYIVQYKSLQISVAKHRYLQYIACNALCSVWIYGAQCKQHLEPRSARALIVGEEGSQLATQENTYSRSPTV